MRLEQKVRYRQTYLGFLWVILQPALAMFIFTITFGRVARFSSEDLPYSVFSLTGLVLWYFFANSIQQGATSIVESADLIRHVSFPRIFFPFSIVLSKMVDLLVSCLFFLAYSALVFPIKMTFALFTIPLYMTFGLALTLFAAVIVSGVCAQFRDIRYLVPYFLQVLFFATPVAYVIPKSILDSYPLTAYLNPCSLWIMGIRHALFGQEFQHGFNLFILFFWVLGISLLGGFYFFRVDRFFADEL